MVHATAVWCHWDSSDGRSKIAQIILPESRVNDLLTELHGGSSGGHLGVNKTFNKVRQRYYWLQARNDVEKWCQQCDTCAVSRGSRTRNWGQMHQYNIGAPFDRIAINVTGPLPTEGPRKPIPPDHYGLFYRVAGILHHPQSRGFDGGRSASYQLLLPLQSTVGATQWPGP
jgi:hypothetical protein